MIRTAAITIGALLLLLAAAGCGAGNGGRLSHDELASRAGKICAQQAQQVLKIPRGPATPENAAGYYGAVVGVVQQGVRKFHKLKPPKREDATYKQLLNELDHNLDILRQLRATAAAQLREQYVVALSNLHRSRLKIDALYKQLDFSGCAG
jgi:hypothetical protein